MTRSVSTDSALFMKLRGNGSPSVAISIRIITLPHNRIVKITIE